MAERNFAPKTIYQDQREIVRSQPPQGSSKPFADGAFQDLDGALVPANGVHKLYNYRAKRNGLEARGGTKLWTATTLPAISGRTGYSLTKTGSTVTKTVGTNFAESDVGNYIVYDDGSHERISAWISTTQVTMEVSTAHAASVSAYLRGPVNAPILYHEKQGVYVMFIDTRLFYADEIEIDSWTEIYKSGTGLPPMSAISDMRMFDDGMVLFNRYGIFYIDLDNFMYWKMNSAVPSTVLTSSRQYTSDYIYCRRQLYKMARIDGAGATGDRYTSGASIRQESGTCLPDSSDNDFAQRWTSRPIGPADTTYGYLFGGYLVAPYDAVTGWQTFATGQFRITINGENRNVVCDFTSVISMDQVASRIQTGLRDYWPDALCEYHGSGSTGYFTITSPSEGGSVSETSAGDGATDIGTSIMSCQNLVGDPQTPNYTDSDFVFNLTIPINSDTGLYDAHWTHYTLHSTLDVGQNEINPVNAINSTELYIWNCDIPVAKALTGGVAGGYIGAIYTPILTLAVGEFVPGDKGSKVRFQNGTEVTLTTYIDANNFACDTGVPTAAQSCAIGGDASQGKAIRVLTIQQSGTTVTRQSGDVFSSSDVGRILFLSNGTLLHVVSYTDTDNVEVLESATIGTNTSACIEPKTRRWNDTLRDDPYEDSPNLRSRIAGYSLQNRFFTPLPNSNIGEVTSNMIWVALRGETIIYYCPADTNYRHQAGYHYSSEQREYVQDSIVELSEVGDYLSIKCVHSTRALPLNTFSSIDIPLAGTSIVTSAGNFMVDEHIGVKHYGGVCRIDRKQQIVITSEPGIRIFNGNGYGDNLATERIVKELEKMKVGYACCYDPINGFTFWGLDE